jgi:dTDP-4-dehydrorhamnose reductase
MINLTILLTGGSGLLGKKIKEIMPECLAPSHDSLDITDKKSILEYFAKNNITDIIHTAALTSIRKCDENKQDAWNVNVKGTKNIVQALQENNISGYFLYVSTACIFQGDEKMYNEDSIPNPVNFYGLTKLIGESIVQTLSNHLVIRTNFVGKEIWPYERAFTDRFGTYLFADDIAHIMKNLVNENKNGLVHVTGKKVFSMFKLAKLTTPNIKPMSLKEYSGPHLTINMTLDSKRIEKFEISNLE